MSTFTERAHEWLGSQQPPSSPMYIDGATPVAEPPRVPVEQLLTQILEELRRINSTPRESSNVSSVEIKFLANGTPQPTVKAYGDSPVPVDAAVEAYGRTIREATAGQMAGWAATVENLQR